MILNQRKEINSMIITRAPFRVSLCGGGSDLPSFYEKYGGCVISTSIRKYVYLCMQPSFNKDDIVLKYSKTEIVQDVNKINHKLFKQTLKDMKINGVEIASMADVPAGTGLGSSSTFTVALLKLLYAYKNESVSAYKLAKRACEIEIDELGNPIGKQDQFAASFGGLKYYEFCPDGFVKVEPIILKKENYAKLEHSLLMFYTGDVRDANKILKEQSNNVMAKNKTIKGTKKLVELTKQLKIEFENNNIDALGPILHQSWLIKKQLANGISNVKIDTYYNSAIKAGASGGKLLGAGGGGFLLFYVPNDCDRKNVREALKDLKEMTFELDQSGCSIIFME